MSTFVDSIYDSNRKTIDFSDEIDANSRLLLSLTRKNTELLSELERIHVQDGFSLIDKQSARVDQYRRTLDTVKARNESLENTIAELTAQLQTLEGQTTYLADAVPLREEVRRQVTRSEASSSCRLVHRCNPQCYSASMNCSRKRSGTYRRE